MRAPERFGMQKNENKSFVDYQSLFPILTPVHHLHHALRRIEASSNEKYNRNHTTEEKAERETLSTADTVLTTKLSSASPFRLSLLKAEQISELAWASAQNRTNMNGNEMERSATEPPPLKLSPAKIPRPGRRGTLKCARCRRHKRGSKAPCETLPEDPHGPCIPCRKKGFAEICKGRSYPSQKTCQPRRSSDALTRLAAVAAWAEADPSISIMDYSEFRDQNKQINRDNLNRKPKASLNEEEYEPSPGESPAFPDVGFGQTAIKKEPTSPSQRRRRSPSPASKVVGDLEDRDAAWVPKNLAKLLSAYDPSADSTIIDSAVLVALRILQKHRDRKNTVPMQQSFFSQVNPVPILPEQYDRVIAQEAAINASDRSDADYSECFKPDVVNVSQTISNSSPVKPS